MRTWIALLLGALFLNILLGIVGCTSKPEVPEQAAKPGEQVPEVQSGQAKAEQSQ